MINKLEEVSFDWTRKGEAAVGSYSFNYATKHSPLPTTLYYF